MNKAGRDALKNALGNAEDNLYRAKLQQRAMPDWTSGNGEPVQDLITGYQKLVDELKEALKEETTA